MSARSRILTLASRLREPLPGDQAKHGLAPRPARGRLGQRIDPGARVAAVLVLLVPEGDRMRMPLLVRRSVTGDVHSGQIALPGGGLEADETVEAAALREAQEELGVDPCGVELLGRLSPQWIPVSGYRVEPVVGTCARTFDLRPDPREVAHAFWTDLDRLDPDRVEIRVAERYGEPFEMPGWPLDEGFLWGATAMILAELLALVRRS